LIQALEEYGVFDAIAFNSPEGIRLIDTSL